MKFKKLPVVVDAVMWDGENVGEMVGFMHRTPAELVGDNCKLRIFTLEGVMEAWPGDWIIKGIAGEFYPCRPDIFVQTYEPAEA